MPYHLWRFSYNTSYTLWYRDVFFCTVLRIRKSCWSWRIPLYLPVELAPFVFFYKIFLSHDEASVFALVPWLLKMLFTRLYYARLVISVACQSWLMAHRRDLVKVQTHLCFFHSRSQKEKSDTGRPNLQASVSVRLFLIWLKFSLIPLRKYFVDRNETHVVATSG